MLLDELTKCGSCGWFLALQILVAGPPPSLHPPPPFLPLPSPPLRLAVQNGRDKLFIRHLRNTNGPSNWWVPCINNKVAMPCNQRIPVVKLQAVDLLSVRISVYEGGKHVFIHHYRRTDRGRHMEIQMECISALSLTFLCSGNKDLAKTQQKV